MSNSTQSGTADIENRELPIRLAEYIRKKSIETGQTVEYVLHELRNHVKRNRKRARKNQPRLPFKVNSTKKPRPLSPEARAIIGS